jgi:signal transduction histidine kinase
MKVSLQKRLTWILLALTLSAWVASAALTYFYSSRALLGQVDRQLEQYADLVTYIARVFERQLADGQPLYEAWSGHDYDQAHLEPILIEGLVRGGIAPAINVWESGNLIALVEGSPRFQHPVAEGLRYLDRNEGQNQWRILSRWDDATALWIQVGIELGSARRDMLGTLGSALMPLLVVLPLTIALLYLGVFRGLLPVRSLAEQISRRKSGLLDPVATEGVPEELSEVVSALNQLFSRLALAMESEQRFTANAAHELLTPLAAIKTEVQLCQRQLHDGPAVSMLQRITQRVDRASHIVEQLLTLARVDPDAPVTTDRVRLDELLTEVIAENAHLAADRGLDVSVDGVVPTILQGNADALAIMLRNLLVNAFRYSSDDQAVHINLSAMGSEVLLEICNDCPPLSADEYARLCDRFYRVPGSAGLGAGLGLSIVSRIATLHGARLETGPGEDGRGFCARIVFPQSG